MTSSHSPRRGDRPASNQVQARTGAADTARLDRPEDHARIEGALEGYEAARRYPPNRAWATGITAVLRERNSRSATSGT
jgi:hypothetical protein